MQTPISLAIERKGLTHKQVAQALGVSRQAVTRWASGAAPTLSNLRRLAELLGVSVSLLTGENIVVIDEKGEPSSRVEETSDLVLIPVLDVYGSCGGGGNPGDDLSPVQLIGVSPSAASSWPGVTGVNNLHIIHTLGDSMEPTLKRGSSAVIDKNQTTILADGIYCLQAETRIFIKRVQVNIDGSLTLLSDNKMYPPQTIPREIADTITVVGRLVLQIRADVL